CRQLPSNRMLIDGLVDLDTCHAHQIYDDEGQLPLVEQIQRLARPADREDAVVAGVVDGVGHAADSTGGRRPPPAANPQRTRNSPRQPPSTQMPARSQPQVRPRTQRWADSWRTRSTPTRTCTAQRWRRPLRDSQRSVWMNPPPGAG